MLSVYRKPKGGTAPVRVNICEVGELPMTALKGSPSVRSSADAILAKLREGTNPNIERRQQQAEAKRQQAADNLAGLTLGQAFEKYVEVKELRKQTLDGYRRAIERDLKPWKDKPLKDITGAMAVARHAELRKDSAHVAMRAMQVLRAVHIFATDFYGDDDEEQPARPFGRCPVDKLNKIVEKWSRTKARTRKLRTEDLGQWLAAVRSLPEQQKRADGDWARVAVYLELLLLTGLRRREAAYMLWADVDLRGDTMTVRATKNGDDHTLPITARVRELLAIRKRAADAARDLAQRDPTDANKAAAEHAATYVIGTAQVQRQLDAIEATTGITATPHLISKDLPLGLTG
jgi:integrase